MGDKSAYEKVSYRLNLFVVFFYMYLLCAFDLLHACEKKKHQKTQELTYQATKKYLHNVFYCARCFFLLGLGRLLCSVQT